MKDEVHRTYQKAKQFLNDAREEYREILESNTLSSPRRKFSNFINHLKFSHEQYIAVFKMCNQPSKVEHLISEYNNSDSPAVFYILNARNALHQESGLEDVPMTHHFGVGQDSEIVVVGDLATTTLKGNVVISDGNIVSLPDVLPGQNGATAEVRLNSGWVEQVPPFVRLGAATNNKRQVRPPVSALPEHKIYIEVMQNGLRHFEKIDTDARTCLGLPV